MKRFPMAIFLLLFGLPIPVRGDDAAEAKKIAKAHLAAAQKGLEVELRVYRVPQLFIWSRRVLFAELDVHDKLEDRLAAFENHVKRVKEYEAKVIELHRNNSVPVQDVVEAKFQCARAEAWLAEAKRTKAKESPKKKDADTPSSAPPVVPPGAAEASSDKKQSELTDKQKAAWEAKRKEVADYPYLVVGYNTDEKEWMTCVYADPKLVKYEWRKKEVDLWHKEEKDSAGSWRSRRPITSRSRRPRSSTSSVRSSRRRYGGSTRPGSA